MAIRTIDLDNKPTENPTERRITTGPNFDNLNKVGLVELGKKVQAMTIEEKTVVAQNLPVDIMLGVIEREFERYQALEAKLADILKRFDK